MTRWEQNEIANLQRIATRRIGQELQQLENQLKALGNRPQWSALDDQKAVLEGTLKNIKNINNLKGQEFEHQKKILLNQGSCDYEMKKAINYKETWLREVLPNFKNFRNYKTLVRKINSIQNPLDFVKLINSMEKIGDINLYYPKDKAIDGSTDEDQFDIELENAGII